MTLILPQRGRIRQAAAGGFTDPSSLTNSFWIDGGDTSALWTGAGSGTPTADDRIYRIDNKGSDTRYAYLEQPTEANRAYYRSGGFLDFATTYNYLLGEKYDAGLTNGPWSIVLLINMDDVSNTYLFKEYNSDPDFVCLIFAKNTGTGTGEIARRVKSYADDVNNVTRMNDTTTGGGWTAGTLQVITLIYPGGANHLVAYKETSQVSGEISHSMELGTWGTTTDFQLNYQAAFDLHHAVIVDYDIRDAGTEFDDLVTWLKTEGGL